MATAKSVSFKSCSGDTLVHCSGCRNYSRGCLASVGKIPKIKTVGRRFFKYLRMGSWFDRPLAKTLWPSNQMQTQKLDCRACDAQVIDCYAVRFSIAITALASEFKISCAEISRSIDWSGRLLEAIHSATFSSRQQTAFSYLRWTAGGRKNHGRVVWGKVLYACACIALANDSRMVDADTCKWKLAPVTLLQIVFSRTG